MWYVISNCLMFFFGVLFGIFLMCLVQMGKDADKTMQKIENERKKEK